MQLFILTSSTALLAVVLFVFIITGVIIIQRKVIEGQLLIGQKSKLPLINVLKATSSRLYLGFFLSIVFVALAFNYSVYKTTEVPVVEPMTFEADLEIIDIPEIEQKIEIEEVIYEEPELEVKFVEVEKKEVKVEKEIEYKPLTTPSKTVKTSNAGEKKSLKNPIKRPVKAKAIDDNKDYARPDFTALFSKECDDLTSKRDRKKCSDQSLRDYMNATLDFPLIALENDMQGTVWMEFIVNKDGKVEKIKMAKSSGYKILDNAAQDFMQNKLLKESKWLPAKMGTKVVRQKIRVPVSFKLN